MLVVISHLLDGGVCRVGAHELFVVWVEPSKRLFHGALSGWRFWLRLPFCDGAIGCITCEGLELTADDSVVFIANESL